MKKTLVIKIKKEDLPKRRAGIKPSKVQKVKIAYTRKPKHSKKDSP